MNLPVARNEKRFHLQGFISLLLALLFLLIVFSGVILYISPKGRVAHWTGWSVFSLDKEEWSAFHTMVALLFAVAGGVHLYLNWRTFWHYIKSRVQSGLNLKLEMVLAAMLVVLFLGGTLLALPPFHWLDKGNEAMQQYWEDQASPAPAPHAEEFTLDTLAEQIDMPVEQIIERLNQAGITGAAPSTIVGDLARQHNQTPNQLFEIIQPSSSSTGGPGAHGRGFGRMTVEQFAAQAGIPTQTALERLENAGIEATVNSTLRSLTASGQAPSYIAEIIRGEKVR